MAVLPIPASFIPAQAAALRSSFAGLNSAQRASLPSITAAVRAGASANEIQRAIAGTDAAMRRTTLLDIVRAARAVTSEFADLRFLRRDRRPNPRRLPEALTTIRRDFSFTVRGTLLAPDGSTFEQAVNVATDALLTRGEIEGVAAGDLGSGRYGEVLEVMDIQLVGGVRAGPAGTVFGSF